MGIAFGILFLPCFHLAWNGNGMHVFHRQYSADIYLLSNWNANNCITYLWFYW